VDVETAPDRLRILPSWLLGQLTVAARRSVGAVLAENGIHRSQYALLAALEQFGPLSQVALSERSGLDRSDVVRWIDELAGAGAVERTKDPDDRRRNVVSISAQGRRLLKRLDAKLRAAQDELLHRLSPRERAQLVGLLSRALGVAAR
jgi:MarR family transcriptional regulator, lower aerobic nicotinate degradation pathway regulator